MIFYDEIQCTTFYRKLDEFPKQAAMRIPCIPMMANAEFEDYFTVGTQVKIVTINKTNLSGEIVAFDNKTRTMMIKKPSENQHGLEDVFVINLDYVKELEASEEPSPNAVPDTLPWVPLAKFQNRLRQSVEEKRQQLNYVGVDVPLEGQLLMNSISKTITDVRWDKQSIVVMDSVTIKPPYTTSDCQLTSKENLPQKQTLLAHIRKVVDKHQKDEQSRQAFPQIDSRRSMSPVPATSSSSSSSLASSAS